MTTIVNKKVAPVAKKKRPSAKKKPTEQTNTTGGINLSSLVSALSRSAGINEKTTVSAPGMEYILKRVSEDMPRTQDEKEAVRNLLGHLRGGKVTEQRDTNDANMVYKGNNAQALVPQPKVPLINTRLMDIVNRLGHLRTSTIQLSAMLGRVVGEPPLAIDEVCIVNEAYLLGSLNAIDGYLGYLNDVHTKLVAATTDFL